jgi:glycosyltransferase involved in cell wall biosynthesis
MAGEQMSSGQRVAFLASEYPPYVYGGLGTHVRALTCALAKHDVEVELFVPYQQGGYESSPPGVKLHNVQVDNPRSDTELWLSFCSNTIARVQQQRELFTLIHCHDWPTILAGICLRKILNVPLVFSIHLPQRGGPNLAMENLGVIYADHLLVNSNAVAQEITARGLPIRSLGVIPNGVELERWPGISPVISGGRSCHHAELL